MSDPSKNQFDGFDHLSTECLQNSVEIHDHNIDLDIRTALYWRGRVERRRIERTAVVAELAKRGVDLPA